MELTIYEVLREAAQQKKIEDRARVLQRNSTKALKIVLGYALDPQVKWLLPEGVPTYTPNKDRKSSGRLKKIADKLHYFVDGTEPIKNPIMRERNFIALLEDIDPRDAEVVLAIKEKKLPFDQLTREVIEKAFPNMTKDWPKDEPVKKVAKDEGNKS